MRGLPGEVRAGGRYDDWRGELPPSYLVVDVDGTVLGAAPEPTDAVARALRGAEERGLRVGFATGRMTAAVRPLWEQVRLPGPHILHDGAVVRAGGRTLHSWPLGSDHVEEVLRLCAQHDWYAEIYVGDGYLVTDARPEAAVHWDMLEQPPDGTAADLSADDDVLKITLAVFGEPVQPVVAALQEVGLKAGAATSPRAPEVTFVNVTDPAASKGQALRAAAEHLALPLGAVAAVGDGWNDLPMLEVAGTAIAMGQAPGEVRRAAHLVVPEVGEDGVVHAVELCLGSRLPD